MPSGVCPGGCLSSAPPLPPTSPPCRPRQPPSTSVNILVEGNLDKEMQMARNLTKGDSKDIFVPLMRGGAPFAEASKPTKHEIGLVTSIFKY
jgi:hypothetical protein